MVEGRGAVFESGEGGRVDEEGSEIEWSIIWRPDPCGPVDIPDRQRLENQAFWKLLCGL